MKIKKEVGVGLEKDHFQWVIIGGTTEAQAILDQGQDQEWVLTVLE